MCSSDLRAIGMDIYGEAGVFTDERAGSAGVVQMDVREKDGVEIAHAEAVGPKIFAESFERGARTRIDNGAMAVRFEKRGSNGVRTSRPEIV